MRMVQRKLADKLGIQADHVESKKGSSPSRNQYNKNEGAADLKKTMEKSRSMQHSDIESLRTPPPTSDHVKTRAATPQRQSPEGSPNYMKSTSSFDARREMKSNNSRLTSGSVHKPVDVLARTSSLKVVRTLIKTPSFKPARATKKYPPIALCEDFDVQKPTCSSTLKDLKMPVYLELSAGATESEGTSATKVCPYTYCSLNGHHHAPVPPLKSFLSAKRRMLKTQKVIKPVRQYGQSDSKASEVESEEGHHYEPGLKLKVTDNTNSSYEVILTDEVQVGFYDERSVSSGAWSDDGESEFDGSYHNMDLGKPYFAQSVESQERENSISHPVKEFQATSVEKSKVPESGTSENDGNCESVETLAKENSVSHSMEEFQARSIEKSKVPEASDEIPEMNYQLGSDAIKCTSDVEEVALGLQGDVAAEQEHVSWLLYQDLLKQDQVETHKNYKATFNSGEGFELDCTRESRSNDDVLNNSFLTKTEYEDADQEKEPHATESFDGIRIPDSLRDHMSNANRTSNEEMSLKAKHLSWTTGSRKPVAELEDVRDFNPREPNFLPEEPDLEPEKVDLRHQLMDERRNSEEWMVDYALRQAVTKLAPARSKRVTLLVEAFEKVLPTPSYSGGSRSPRKKKIRPQYIHFREFL